MKKLCFLVVIIFLFSIHYSLSESKKSSQNNSDNKQSATDKICSSITDILNNEIGKTKNKTKLKVLNDSLNYVNGACRKGEAPDLTKVTEGLNENDKLSIRQRTGSSFFDGTDPNLKEENLSNLSKTLPALAGKTGEITDLKSYDPSLKTSTNPVSELKTASSSNPSQAPFLCDCNAEPFWAANSGECFKICCAKYNKCDAFCYSYSDAQQRCQCCKDHKITYCLNECCTKYGLMCEPGFIDKIKSGTQKLWEDIKSSFIGKGRPLTEYEIAEAEKIFGDKINYSKVRIVTGKDRGLWGTILTLDLPGGSAVTSGYTIYFPGYDPNSGFDRATLLHEMTHIYQRETHNWLEFQWKKLTGRNGTYTPPLIAAKSFNDYNFEEQASIIQAYSSGYVVPPEGQGGARKLTPDEKALIETMLKNAGLLK
ncbi:MAG: DUF4157 domain-containing protein [Elusimicrobia bacterium]|nr:DUF4157 domain-containing protein [Elusimicrobiota bacterium]